MSWRVLDAELDRVPGTVSVWCGLPGGPPRYTRLPEHAHYAASTMKVAVLAALHRAAAAGTLPLDRAVPVVNEFRSAAPAAPPFGCDPAGDSDPAVWHRLGTAAPLDWLAHRMIVRSSNLATNILLSHLGLAAVAQVWAVVRARHSVTARGIEDGAARAAGITNLVTAADLARLLSAIAAGAANAGALAPPDHCAAMLDTLCQQEHRNDLPAGLPPDTRIAAKGGWVSGVRHSVGAVFPADAPPYVLAVCTTTALPGATARDLVARVAAVSWTDRANHTGTGVTGAGPAGPGTGLPEPDRVGPG